MTRTAFTRTRNGYPRFFDDPHPTPRHAVTIDLVRGKARHTDYANNRNPPILHRKEAFLPAEHPKRRLFAALTRPRLRSTEGATAESQAHRGEQQPTITTRNHWKEIVVVTNDNYFTTHRFELTFSFASNHTTLFIPTT